MALDSNSVQNPCYGSPQVHSLDCYPKEAAGYKAVLPKNGHYDLSHPAALHRATTSPDPIEELQAHNMRFANTMIEALDS